MEIEVPMLPESIFLVPDDQADELRKRARNPGRMWTIGEVRQLKASGATVEEARKIAEAKMLMQAGALLWLRPRKAKDGEQVELFE